MNANAETITNSETTQLTFEEGKQKLRELHSRKKAMTKRKTELESEVEALAFNAANGDSDAVHAVKQKRSEIQDLVDDLKTLDAAIVHAEKITAESEYNHLQELKRQAAGAAEQALQKRQAAGQAMIDAIDLLATAYEGFKSASAEIQNAVRQHMHGNSNEKLLDLHNKIDTYLEVELSQRGFDRVIGKVYNRMTYPNNLAKHLSMNEENIKHLIDHNLRGD